MAYTPTECAHYLLSVFPAFNLRADECLRRNSFTKPFAENTWRAADYNIGLDRCIEKEWVKIDPKGGICVTQAGLDEIGA